MELNKNSKHFKWIGRTFILKERRKKLTQIHKKQNAPIYQSFINNFLHFRFVYTLLITNEQIFP